MALSPALRQRNLLFAIVSAAAFSVCPFAAPSQSSITGQTAPQPRVHGPVNPSSLVTLAGNVLSAVRPENDLGAAPASLAASRITLVLRRSSEQEAALQTWLQQLQDPGSANYRQWLTPEEFGQRFGVAQADLTTIETWLRSQGFTVGKVGKGRMTIEFSGTVGQLEQAFHTSIHSYLIHGERHWANSTEPQIPAALAPVVAGVSRLNDLAPQPSAARGTPARYDPKTGFTSGRLKRDLSFGDDTQGYLLLLGPADLATIYDTPTKLNPAFKGTAFDGTGVTLGVIEDSNLNLDQVANYRATFGLAAKAPEVVVDGQDPGINTDAGEAYLDAEVAGAIAPNVNVIVYTTADSFFNTGVVQAAARAVDDNQADILSVSFNQCEALLGSSVNLLVNNLWQQAAAQGITVAVSSGDGGSAGCDNFNSQTVAEDGLAVNGLASTPYNVSVGGTDFDVLDTNLPSSFTKYVDVTNTLAKHRSALSYIPEQAWNDSTVRGYNSSLSANVPWTATSSTQYASIFASGGGTSSCATQSSAGVCTAGYPVPAWQSAYAKSSSGRNQPDVSFMAGNGLYSAETAICSDQDPDSEPDCVGDPTTGNAFNVTGVGGTSVSAPIFAGILALIKQKTGSRLGQADYVLYDLARTKYATVFHDVNTGNDAVNCTQGTPGCAADSAGYYFLTGFNAGAGYDEATGLGSLDATLLLDNWSAAALTATSTSLKLNGGTAALKITHGSPVTVAVDVTAGSQTAAGDIALVDSLSPSSFPNLESVGVFTLSGGQVNGTTESLPGGSYNVTAHYGGSSTLAASNSSAIAVTVSAEASNTALQLNGCLDPASGKLTTTISYGFLCDFAALPYGQSATLTNPNGHATGTVTFASGSTSLGSANLASNGIAEFQTALLPAGQDSVTASYPGDSSFKASVSTPLAMTVLRGTTSLVTFFNGATANAGSPVTVQAYFNLDSQGLPPTGNIVFARNGKTIGTSPITALPPGASSITGASATFTTSALPAGTDTVTASYVGDANYKAAPASAPASIYIVPAQSTLTVSASSTAIGVNQSLVFTISASSGTGLPAPTGTVDVTTPGYYGPSATLSGGAVKVTIPPNLLPLGLDTFTISYGGDQYYGAASTTIAVRVKSIGTLTPTVTVTPAVSVVRSFPAQVNVTVAGPSGKQTPTGTVQLSTLLYTSPEVALTGGAATISLDSSQLAVGNNALTVVYTGDFNYATTKGTGKITVAGTPAVTITPASSTIAVNQPLKVSVSVAPISGLANPTGDLILFSGSYTSAATAISTAGAATITIPANALALGKDTLMVSYTGDANYNPTLATAPVTVTASSPPAKSASGPSQ
jgi:hypothetical protein